MASQEDASIPLGKKDVAWKYNFLADPKEKNSVTCSFCGKVTKGGIYRAKQHQVGGFKNVADCRRCPVEVKMELRALMEEKKTQKDAMAGFGVRDSISVEDDDDEVEVLVRPNVPSGSSGNKRRLTMGSMDSFVVVKGKGVAKQSNIKDSLDKNLRGKTIQKIARFFYQANIAFNCCKLQSFKEMLQAVGEHGPNLKPPSYHELRVPLLRNEVKYTEDQMQGHREEWALYGCSIMSDCWTDRKNRSIINLMVNCTKGTMFVDSYDASSIIKTGEKIYELLDKFVERIGEANVVQVITDNGSNYVLAGKFLQNRRPHLFWTPCAAHCVDLMLEDIGKIPTIKTNIKRAVFVVGFIYNHVGVLNMMRGFTNNKELVRHGITRFATTFLTLQSIHKQKHNLRTMFTSEKWSTSKWSKDPKGKKATEIILMPTFWNYVVEILKFMGPLVSVLRLVDSERKPAMGYIYAAMDHAKEAIASSFKGREDRFRDVFAIIERRWECQMKHPLHAAGHFLNPEFFYSKPEIQFDDNILDGLLKCIERLVPDDTIQDKITSELAVYKRGEGNFGRPMAVRTRATKSPVEWWSLFGTPTPHLQRLAIRILSLTCSASGCERNWSVFEHIHSKKRNALEHKRLQDLVYVRYNQALRQRYDLRDSIDPIALTAIDDSNEWLLVEMEDAEDECVFGDDGLTWGHVARASGASEVHTYTRQYTRARGGASSSRAVQEIEEVEVVEEEEEEAYQSNEDEDEAAEDFGDLQIEDDEADD